MRYLNIFLPALLLVVMLCPLSGTPPGKANSMAFGLGGGDLSFRVGIKGGINFTVAIPLERFSVLQPIQGADAGSGEKDYALLFRNLGHQYGFIGMLDITSALSVSLEPTFSNYTLKYDAESEWIDASNPADRIAISTHYTDKLRYFEIPVVLRYVVGTGQIKPYLAAGFFYGMLTGASGHVESSTVQYINDAEIPLENSNFEGDISNNYIKTRLAAFPGAGLMVDLGFATVFAEADYFFTLHNVVDESDRYANQQSTGGFYNVPDNLRLDNLVINLGILFNVSRITGQGRQGRGRGSAVECPPVNKKR